MFWPGLLFISISIRFVLDILMKSLNLHPFPSLRLYYYENTEAVVQRCSVKKLFLKISQNSQENTCARVSFLKKLQTETSNFIKKEALAQVFSC